jgi:hypothetical protein
LTLNQDNQENSEVVTELNLEVEEHFEETLDDNLEETSDDDLEENLDDDLEETLPENDSISEPQKVTSLIQLELARRLDVHSSTVGKRKSDPDFSEWSKSKDPEGIAWKYSRKSKMFNPI